MISELKLQSGSPIDVGICKLFPLTLKEITDVVGEAQYTQYLSALLIDKSSLNLDGVPKEIIEIINKSSDYEIILYHSFQDEEMRKVFCRAFSIFIREEVNYHLDGYFYIGEKDEKRRINQENFESIKQVLKKQNYLHNEEDEFKPANDKARELFDKLQKAKAKIKKNNNDGLKLSDIVSIVATYSNDISILTVWNLTIYQLYESYLRLIMWDNYHTNYMHLPHMDEDDRKSLIHWASKLKQNK